jgi:probable rRNA maturation factor
VTGEPALPLLLVSPRPRLQSGSRHGPVMVLVEHPRPPRGLPRRELSRFLRRAAERVGLSGEVNVLLADDERLRTLNQTFRRKNKPTDVLSFPSAEQGAGGDLAISLDTAAAQAAELGHALDVEVKVLVLHGLLHLAGFDHEQDRGEMLSRETELRREFELPGGLIERTSPKQPGAPRQ